MTQEKLPKQKAWLLMNDEKSIEIFEKMPVKQAVIKLAIPTVLGQLVVLVYNLADTWFVGQTKDNAQVAAVTVSFSLFIMLNALANLFGVGGGSLISRLLGQHEYKSAGKVVSFLLWGGGVFALIYSTLVLVFRSRLLSVLGADTEVFPFAYQYLFWTVIIGGVPTVLNLVLANIVRAEGKANAASIGTAIGGILNIILDPIFIFAMNMKVEGAALATCLSNVVSMVYFFVYIVKNRNTGMLPITFLPGKLDMKVIGEVFSIGIPSSLQTILSALSNSFMVRFMSGYATSAVAGFGVAQHLETVSMQVIMGISTGVLPLIAYSYAAGKRERMKQSVRFAGMLAFLLALIFLAFYEAVAPFIVEVFIRDTETVAFGAAFIRLRSIAVPFMAFTFILVAVFQGTGAAKEAFILSLMRKGVIDIPLMFVMDHIFPMYGLMLVQPIVEFCGMLFAMIVYRMKHKNHIKA